MFDITPDDIAQLNDEQLRTLVGRLCEAEVRSRGLSAAHVRYGGNQNASDGGIDVRVALPATSAIDGFVPRPNTGFQVKAQDMPRNKIVHEIRPKGVVRPAIKDLASSMGAYIIVSSRGSISESARQRRRDAMAEAVKGVPGVAGLVRDFYDRTRVATWVRSHSGLIPWVRTEVGRAIPGWQSYGSWAYAPGAATDEYLRDDKSCVRTSKNAELTAQRGIEQIREHLGEPRRVVRLIGLSGVGKTRLVQALFDERIGGQSLEPALAIYTDVAQGPDPQPLTLASNLVASGTRAVLVVDNCSSELHRQLSELSRCEKSRLSVITIEFDIRDDQPEGTEVFELDSSSQELIESLIRQRYPAVSQVDTRTIADFSGGNARIAIALAATIRKDETVAGLADKDLLDRLLRQGRDPDASLERAVQICSLVYSFDCEDVSDAANAELACLSRLVEVTPLALRQSVAELKRRGLAQQRGVWRAVLPHAIANRFAAIALENIPYSVIADCLLKGQTDRLAKSFARRLSYLHASKEAVAIVKSWLAPDGMLGNVAALNEDHRAMLQNVAPASPEDALAALERSLLGPDAERAARDCAEYLDLLLSLAYDSGLFDRSVELIVRILATGGVDARSHRTEMFVSLFHLLLSGAHATIEQRVRIIAQLLGSSETNRRLLGLLALKAAMKASHFSSSRTFSFGARSRDYGYRPRTNDDVQHWYRSSLALAETFVCTTNPVAGEVRAALAEEFRDLWIYAV